MFSKVFHKFAPFFIDNVEEFVRAGQATDDDIILDTSFACWVTKVTNIHSEYVLLHTQYYITTYNTYHIMMKKANLLRITAFFFLHVFFGAAIAQSV